MKEPSAGEPIRIITRHYAPEPIGSAPPIERMAIWLAKAGYDVTVFTVRPNYPDGAIFDGYRHGERDVTKENGVTVNRRWTPVVKNTRFLNRLLPEIFFFAAILKARWFLEIPKSRLWISLCPSIFTVLAVQLWRARGIHHTAIVHDIQSNLGTALGGGLTKRLMRLLAFLETWTLNRVDHVVVLSVEMANALRGQGVKTPISIQPPMVDIATENVPKRRKSEPPQILYSGNLGKKQGLGQILDFAGLCLQRGISYEFVVRGMGSQQAQLSREISERGLTNVNLLPLAPPSEINAMLAEADIVLVPQQSSGGDAAVPSKIYTIMAAGRTFVATGARGSTLDRLATLTGAFFCVEPDSPEALLAQVRTLLDDRDRLQDADARALQYVRSTASTEQVMRNLRPVLAPGNESMNTLAG